LNKGLSLSEALEKTVPELSPRAIAMLAAAERIGRLPAALHRLLLESRRARRNRPPDHMLAATYGLTMLIALCLILGAVGTFIMPQFHKIFADFNVALPSLTTSVISIFQQAGPILLPFAVILAFACAGWSVWAILHGHQRRPPLQLALLDRLIWHLPVIGSVQRDRGMADACQLIAEALAAGAPLHRAVKHAADLPMNTVLKRRLQRFGDCLTRGQPLREAAQHAKLPQLAAGMFATAAATGDARRVFDYLGRYYAMRFSRLAEFFRASVLPIIVLILAVLVGTVVVGLFLPLVKLIHVQALQALGGS